MKKLILPFGLLLFAHYILKAQTAPLRSQRVSVTVKDSLAKNSKDTLPPASVTTHHQITVDGKLISYTAKAGYMPLKDKDEKQLAKIFFVAYTKDGEAPGHRPVTFVFNGGPGSAAIWLHMGSFVAYPLADNSLSTDRPLRRSPALRE